MPQIDPTCFIAANAVVVGDVRIGAYSSVWFGCVLRGDVQAIRVGAGSNIQDGSVIHVTSGGQGTHIGDRVTIGHMALLHACTLEDEAFVGMRAVVMDNARIARHAMLGAGALLTPGKQVASHQLWLGSPANYARNLTADEIAEITNRAEHYVVLGREYKIAGEQGS